MERAEEAGETSEASAEKASVAKPPERLRK